MSVRLQNRSSRSMIHTRFRLDLMVCSLSRKNQAEMEKKMTTPTLPPLAMKNRKKISIASGSLLIGKPFWVIKWYIRIMNIAMMRSSSMLEFLCPPHLRFGNVPVRRVWRLCGCRSPRPGSFCSQFSSSLWSLFPPNPTHPNRLVYSIKR